MSIAQPSPRFSGYSNFGQGTPKTISVGTSSVQLLASNSSRRYAQINNNGTRRLWIGLGAPAVVGFGQSINPRSMLNFENNSLFLGQITAVSENGTVNTDVIEGV